MIRQILTLFFILTPLFSWALSEEGIIKTVGQGSIKESQILFENSLKLFYEKNWKGAEEGFNQIIKGGEEPWKKRSVFMLGRTFLESGRREEARDLFLTAVSEYDELADYALYYFSESLITEKDYENAAEILDLLSKTYSESSLKGQARFKEAESFYLSGNYKKAISAFNLFISENPKDPMVPEARFYTGKALRKSGEYEMAEETFKRLWIEKPAASITDRIKKELENMRLNSKEHLIRAENLSKASLYSKALSDLQKAIELEDDIQKISEIRLRIGITLFKVRRYDEAIDVINKVLRNVSGINSQISREATYYLAKAYLRRGNREKFLELSDEIYRLYPDDRKTPKILLTAADELRRSGQKDEAFEIYNRIIKEYPENAADALYHKGWMEYQSHDFVNSSKDMKLLVKTYPESTKAPQALYWEARCYDKDGGGLKTENLYSKIAKKYPSNFYGYLASERMKGIKDISRRLDSTGRYNGIETLESLSPEMIINKEISFPKVRELKILGMNKEAIKELDHLRDRIPGELEDQELLISLGEAYIGLGEYRKAIYLTDGNSKRDKRYSYLSYPLGFWLFLTQSSNETSIDPYLLAALIREESRFDQRAVSKAGAKGLMQVVPTTWDWISGQRNKIEIQNPKSKIQNNPDPFDPGENIARGSWYLRYLLNKFNRNMVAALTAYNAGPEAVSSWMKNAPEEPDEFVEEIPYPETKGYVKRVLRSYMAYQKIYYRSEKDL